MSMPFEDFVPQNLAKLGVPMAATRPDLITIYRTSYPFLTNYAKLCKKLSIEPFGGGDWQIQGPLSIGKFTSGYRDLEYNASVDGAKNSAHLYGFAGDIWWKTYKWCYKAAEEAQHLFNRIILYKSPFLHLDFANSIWMQRFSNGRRFGVADESGNYQWYSRLDQTIRLHREIYSDKD